VLEKEAYDLLEIIKEHIPQFPIRPAPKVFLTDMPWAEHHLSGIWMYSGKQEGKIIFIHNKMNNIAKSATLYHEVIHYIFDSGDDKFVHKETIKLINILKKLSKFISDKN